MNCFHQRWHERWQRNGWRNSKKKPVENRDLWERILALTKRHQVEFVKVEGHWNDRWNNRCDELARAAAAAARWRWRPLREVRQGARAGVRASYDLAR